ncbi:uncharacterized protein FOMMEDRAFT_17082 [Fomitiporia mediterranea MF3/22]|uniref:uncharacterized protein n=1 Tax=Fomitiporia mediterranea (strain MF3/22) TaxID=694068 RepID=UPI0004408A8A|nr:uncharacterized protein FOMMEDRAFT_17082 [Fomitiporia mediterranea MF3/22]EJD06573.1 hypothetical protein FOMMEDRAFT_17082 [Fomitiporia mediterranea MF3/22]
MPRDIISHLPEDVIQLIAVYSDIADVFALKQTCRSLNGLTESDYLWHRLFPREELPLDLPPFVDFRKISAYELRASALRALKLRNNWSWKHPRVREINIVDLNTSPYDGGLDELKLLNGGSILLVIRRDRHSQRPIMFVSVFNLINARRPQLAAQLSLSASMKDFDACLDPEGTRLILAASVHKVDAEALEVYSIPLPLDTPSVCTGAHELAYSFELIDGGLFHKVSIHGDFLAGSFIDQPFVAGVQSSHVLVVNWKTRQQITITPPAISSFDQLDIKVLPPYLGIVAASVDNFDNAQVTLVPLSVIAYGSELEEPEKSEAKQRTLPQFPHAIAPIMDFYDIVISDNTGYGPYVPPTSLSLIVFPTLSRLDVRQSKKALHLRFSISHVPGPISTNPEADAPSEPSEEVPCTSIQLEKSVPFEIPVGSYPEYPQVGATGRRGVWLEQSLKSDYVQLLRLDYDPTTNQAPSVSVLLPPQPQFPFKLSSCRALAFDESTGRLCVGLYNGSVYILDYV